MRRTQVVALLCAAGLTLAGAAGAGAIAQGAQAPPVRVVNIHQAYTRALPEVSHGPVAYGMRPKGAKASPGRAFATCTEPDCPLTWQSGTVEHTPKVYVLLWGPAWHNTGADFAYLYHLYSGLGVTPADSWSTITSQYGDGGGFPAFSGPVLQGGVLYQDTTAPPAVVTPTNLAAEAYAFEQTRGITDLANSQVVIASQTGTTFSDGFGSQYCAWHAYVTIGTTNNIPFTNLPYAPDAGANCGSTYGTYAGFSIIGGHEFAETLSDPYLSAWYDPADNTNDGGGEIGDKCAWFDPVSHNPDIRKVTLSTGSFPMQPLWSNSAFGHTGDGCVISSNDLVTVTNPGTQTTNLGATVSLQVHASSSLGEVLSYTASGLPPGLSLSATGLISGKATYPGNYTVHVTAHDTGTVSATASFAWRVIPRHGAVKLYYHNTHCLDDQGGSLANGTKVQLYTCNGSLAQTWAAFPGGTLRRYGGTGAINTGKCLDIKGASTANGTKLDLYSCNGHWNQVWSYNATTREWRNPYSGKCLDDTGYNLANGTQLEIWTCKGTSNQQWSNV